MTMEHFMDFMWWALAASPLLIGNFGSQPSPPTLDTKASERLTQADYDLKIKNTPQMVSTTGDAGRREYAQNLAFALSGFTNPGSLIYGDQLKASSDALKKTQGDLAAIRSGLRQGKMFDQVSSVFGRNSNLLAPRALTANERREMEAKAKQLESQLKTQTAQIKQIKSRDPVGMLTNAFKDEFKLRDNFLGDMQNAAGSTAEYKRMQSALGKGLSAQQVGQRSAQAAQARAAGMGRVANVSAGQVGAGALGKSLMDQAMERAKSKGQLSAEASRDAVQAARSGMAARGMATGSAGMAAELLNRDRFSRARMAEDLAFAQGVQGQDLSRQFNNVGNTLQADIANQQTAFGREQIISGNQQQANLANMQAMNAMRQFNTGLAADTDRFNAAQRTDNQRFNMGLLQTSAQAADNERARQLGLGQSAYNFALQTNPKMMLAGLGSPYANFTPQALGLMSNQNVQPIYSGGSFGNPYMTGNAFGDFALNTGVKILAK